MRWTAAIVLALVLGAASTVIVAASCAYWRRPSHTVYLEPQRTPRLDELLARRPASFDGALEPAFVARSTGFGVTCTTVYDTRMDVRITDDGESIRMTSVGEEEPESAAIFGVEAGWPLAAVRGEEWVGLSWVSPDPRSERALVKLARVPGPGRERLLPYGPIWSGLVTNAGLFALGWMALLLGPPVARRVVRRSRGLCVTCGYDLRELAGAACPECGRPVRGPSDRS